MVELTVGEELLDLYPKEVISLTKVINDMADISSRNGGFSNKFKIPSTSNNNSILGYPSELNFVTGFKPSVARNAKISVSGLTVELGIIQIEQYSHSKKQFSVSFFSGNTEWNDLLADKQLGDIDLDEYDHYYLPSTIAASMTNTSGYIYPLINYGRYNTLATNNTTIASWMPAMYTHTLIRSMFSDIDWKVGGSIFKDPTFLKHVLPFSRQQMEIQARDLTKVGFAAAGAYGAVLGATPIIYPFVYNGNGLKDYDGLTGVFTSSSNFSANIFGSFHATTTGTVQIRINGIVVASAASNQISVTTNIIIGDTVTITSSLARTSPIQNARKNIFAIIPNDNIIEGGVMNMASTLPDMAQEDFLSTIFNQFGILFTSDNISKTVYLNTFEDIKNNIPNAIDWTDKVDNSKELEIDYTELISDYGKRNQFKYDKNEDRENSIWGGGVKPSLGDGEFVLDNDFLSKTNEVYESEFVSSSNTNCFNNATKLMFIPRWSSVAIPENEPDVDPKPRCAICVNGITISDLTKTLITSINIVGGSGTSNITEVPYVYFDDTFTGISEIDDVNQSLSFGNNVNPKAHKNLLDTYYNDFIGILNNPRKVTGYFLLNERDMNNLNFLIPIYLGGELNNYFYINKIKDYRPLDGGIAKVELILIV